MFFVCFFFFIYPFLAVFFFFNDTATTEIYTLSLHDALPICRRPPRRPRRPRREAGRGCHGRSEEHTSELQSLAYLVCRLLLEKKKQYLIHLLFSTKKKKSQNKSIPSSYIL